MPMVSRKKTSYERQRDPICTACYKGFLVPKDSRDYWITLGRTQISYLIDQCSVTSNPNYKEMLSMFQRVTFQFKQFHSI